MKGQQTEREVKLAAPDGFRFPRLESCVNGATVSPLPRRSLSATYYDTPDLRLARWGLTVRYRTGDNTGWTVKLPEGDGGPALVRRELYFDGPPGEVPAELLELLRAYLRRDGVAEVARLRTTRTGVQLQGAEGEPEVEVVDDRVVVYDGRTISGRFRQLEVEATDERGTGLMQAVTDRLLAAGARLDEVGPKLVHALGPRAAGSPEVPPVGLNVGSQAGDAVRAALAAGVTRLLRHDPGVRVGDDPEDVHQARVATRRLRSDLRTFRSLLDQERAGPLRDELKWAADLLGAARDADVLLERLRRDADRLPQRDGVAVAALLRRLAAERDRARVRVRDGVRSDRYVALIEQLVAFAQVPPLVGEWARPAREALPGVVAPTWKHLQRSVEHLSDPPRPEELHQVRIRAKRCRYASEAVAPAMGKDAAQLASAVADLQGVLGDHHDAYVADAWLREASAELDPPQVLAAGELISLQMLEAARLEQEWQQAWKKASKKSLRRWLG
ncbi:MAG: CYTH and CHAD domain-containing protein [Acidimicrobiia bacterium]|nr:CYTH and CHAD domain-containing protein [Acidimicrobiia bacterium]